LLQDFEGGWEQSLKERLGEAKPKLPAAGRIVRLSDSKILFNCGSLRSVLVCS